MSILLTEQIDSLLSQLDQFHETFPDMNSIDARLRKHEIVDAWMDGIGHIKCMECNGSGQRKVLEEIIIDAQTAHDVYNDPSLEGVHTGKFEYIDKPCEFCDESGTILIPNHLFSFTQIMEKSKKELIKSRNTVALMNKILKMYQNHLSSLYKTIYYQDI